MATEYVSEIHKLLKLGDSHPVIFGGAPEGLPVMADDEHGVHHSHQTHPQQPLREAVMENPLLNGLQTIGQTAHKAKSLVIYPVIFIFAFAFFYLILNFSSLLGQAKGFFIKPQNEQILGDELGAYYTWIGGYYYAVNDLTLVDPNNDIDKDGLSNMDEFVMRTNPTLVDSDGDGFSDGVEIINSHNPWGSGKFTSEQKELAEKIDQILINNRISFNVSQNQGQGLVAGAASKNYDLNTAGRLSIPKLNLTVPLVWSKDPADFEKDLVSGVIHYPGTALPGEQGTIYVSGHSSDYLWKQSPFRDVFARLNFLSLGDDIFIDVYGIDGKVYNYRYQVSGSNVHSPDDQTQFIDNSTNKLNLSTCWPIGTQADRLVVSAVQVGL
jgi:LPXTG-site transpeptidase (sortase) family protein